MDSKHAAVRMRNITKTFGPVVANDKVWLDIYRGEILALLGENPLSAAVLHGKAGVRKECGDLCTRQNEYVP